MRGARWVRIPTFVHVAVDLQAVVLARSLNELPRPDRPFAGHSLVAEATLDQRQISKFWRNTFLLQNCLHGPHINARSIDPTLNEFSAPRLQLKYLPELRFFWDHGIDNANRVQALLEQIRREDEGA